MGHISQLIKPQELTYFTRTILNELENGKGCLGNFLPSKFENDTSVSFTAKLPGNSDVAPFVAWDAEATVGRSRGTRKSIVELPKIARKLPVSEYDRLIARNAPDSEMASAIEETAAELALEIWRAMELLRGRVLVTGKAEIPELGVMDDFGRNPAHTASVANLWTDPSVSRIDDIERFLDVYHNTNKANAGTLLMSKRVWNLLARGNEFANQLQNGVQRPATPYDVQQLLSAYEFPAVQVYDQPLLDGLLAIPDNVLLVLPDPVAEHNFAGTKLGNTVWGKTLAASQGDYKLPFNELPGIVAKTIEATQEPYTAEVEASASGLPILANPNLSMAITVA